MLVDEPDDGRGRRPEVLCGALRRLVLNSLPKRMVRWGKRLANVSSLGSGWHEFVFVDGSIAQADLLFGADGAWSRVRPLVSDAEPV